MLVGRVRVLVLPATGYWRDTANQTDYTAGLVPNSDGYAPFSFTIPGGGQISGNLRLIQLPDGSYEEATDVTDPAVAERVADDVASGSVPFIHQIGTLDSDTPYTIDYFFLGHISADGLAAYATFTYSCAQENASFLSRSAEACLKATGNATATYQLSAGCTALTCTDLAGQAGPSVTAYDNAVKSGDWSTAWTLTSQQITAQYPQGLFVTTLDQQSKSVGTITDIVTPSVSPTVLYTPQGQAYFSVDQAVTLLHGGVTSTKTITSYYLLEAGVWKFWFSA
jgi:hypothetical protein